MMVLITVPCLLLLTECEHIFILKPSFALHSFLGLPQIHPFLPPAFFPSNLDIGV